MSDVHEPIVRSYNMGRIKGKNTKPEIMVRKFLFSKGFRFRIHDMKLPGKPDIVLPSYKTVIFVHGCFWHNHDCNAGKLPEIRKDFWKEKISENINRDKKNINTLENLGWSVLTIWQCKLKNKEERQKTFATIVTNILDLHHAH